MAKEDSLQIGVGCFLQWQPKVEGYVLTSTDFELVVLAETVVDDASAAAPEAVAGDSAAALDESSEKFVAELGNRLN